MYQRLSNRLSVWNNDFIEPIRDTIGRTPSEKICEIEKYSLFHYKEPSNDTIDKGVSSANQKNTPLLVIYAFG